MTWVFIFGTSFYLILMMSVGYFASRRVNTLKITFIVGRKLPYSLAVATLVATWFGAGSCMGVSGTVYANGFYGVIADPFGCTLALFLSGLFFAGPFRRLRLVTISDLLHKVYGSRFEWVATLIMIPFYVGTLASQMLAMGYVFEIVFGGGFQIGIILGSLIVVLYTVSGGMWAVSLTDLIQLGLLTVGLLFIVPLCFTEVNDTSVVFSNFFQEFSTLAPSNRTGSGWLSYSGRIFLTGLGAIMGQDIIQRSLACRSESVARSSAITSGFVYFFLGLIPLFIGIAGREIFPFLDKPEQLIPLLAKEYLSPIAFTIFACGLLSAIMSTADSYLLAGTSLVTNNILLKVLPTSSEKTKIRLLRLVNVLFAILALGLALTGPTIFDMMVHSGATLFVGIFVPASAALFWKGAHRSAAWSAMIGGVLSWGGFLLIPIARNASSYHDTLFSAAAFGALMSLVSYVVASLVRYYLVVERKSKQSIST